MLLLSIPIYQILAFSVVKPLRQLEQGLYSLKPVDELSSSFYLSWEIRSLHLQYIKMVSRIEKQMQYLKKLASTDTLIDLPSRQQIEILIQQKLKIANESNQKFSVMFLDIDHFKQINDVYGHDVGDQALITFAHTIKSCITSDNELLGRFGGDEFVLVAH